MKNQILKTLVLQYALGFTYLVGMGLWDIDVTLSALVGCTAALLPKTYFDMRMSRDAGDKNAAQWLGYAYRSGIGKWVIMGAILATAFSTGYPWNPVVLFAGFVLIQLSGWLAPFVIKGN
jgi:F0F1-type ATP synthase assembly protein I